MMVPRDSQYPYIIKMTVNKKLSRYGAIMQALHATSFLVKHDGKSSLFVSYHAAACQLSAIHEQLKEVAYIKRNSMIPLSVGYSIVEGFGSDYVLIGTQAEQKKFLGNAVEVNMSMHLCKALYVKLNNYNTKAERV